MLQGSTRVLVMSVLPSRQLRIQTGEPSKCPQKQVQRNVGCCRIYIHIVSGYLLYYFQLLCVSEHL